MFLKTVQQIKQAPAPAPAQAPPPRAYQKISAIYMWNMKVGEKKPVPRDCIEHNKPYLSNFKIIGPAEIMPLVPQYSPQMAFIWPLIPHWIITADLGRLLYIYFHGNFYFDVDSKITKPFFPASGGANKMYLFVEELLPSVAALGPREIKTPAHLLRVCNFAFGASVKKHPFLKDVIDECLKRLTYLLGDLKFKPADFKKTDILWVCGPDVMTTVYHQKKHLYGNQIVLLAQPYIHHLRMWSWRDD